MNTVRSRFSLSALFVTATLAFLTLSVGCVSFPVETIPSGVYKGYVPQDPRPSTHVNLFDQTQNKYVSVSWDSLPNANRKRALLPIQSAQVSVSNQKVDGNLGYLDGSVSGEAGSYLVVMDYMKYRVEDVYHEGVLLGSGRIGVGLRIKADVTTSKSNLNLGSIVNIGIEASNDNLKGTISVDIIGIDSKDVTNLIPLNSDINETSIQAALQALASIKSKVWEVDNITPHLLATKQAVSGVESSIRNNLTSTSYSFVADASSILLRNYWKPDGKNINAKNQAELKAWLDSQNYEVSLTSFIYSKEHVQARQRAVATLDIMLVENEE